VARIVALLLALSLLTSATVLEISRAAANFASPVSRSGGKNGQVSDPTAKNTDNRGSSTSASKAASPTTTHDTKAPTPKVTLSPHAVVSPKTSTGALLWRYPTDSINRASPVVSNGNVYQVSENGTVYAVNASSGAPVWHTQPGGHVNWSLTVSGGVVYVGSSDGNLYALRASDGGTLRVYPMGSVFYPAVVLSGMIYVGTVTYGSTPGYLYALDAATGALVWRDDLEMANTPTVDNGVIYFGSFSCAFNVGCAYAVRTSDGAVLWSAALPGCGMLPGSTPAVVDGVAYLSCNFGALYALNASTGTIVWTYQSGNFEYDSPIVANGVVYIASCDDGSLNALQASDGSVLWRNLTVGCVGDQTPTLANGVVYVGSVDHSIYALSATDGTSLWSYATRGQVSSSLAVVNETVYAASFDDYLYALYASPPTQSPAQAPTGSERLGGGNPSTSPVTHCKCQPIDTYSGNFTHTFTDISVSGRGLPLTFSHTYNAGAASQNGPLGYGWTHGYNWALSVDGSSNVTIQQENGSTVSFTPAGGGAYTAPSRVLASLVHNGDGSYTFTRSQDQTHYTFSASGKLTAETDRNGYTTSLSYNGGGQLTTVTDPAGRTLSFTYDGNGHVTQVTDPASRIVTFSYDGNGNLQATTDVNGGTTHFTYDANHLLLTMTDPRGGVVTNVYDGGGRVTSQTDAMGRQTTLSYTGPDGNGNSSATITDPRGNVTVEQYYNGLLLAETKGYGTAQAATWNYTYDPVSLGLASIIDPNGYLTRQTWDASGNLLSKTDPLGRITTYTYDAQNDLLTSTDPSSVTTTNTYDAHGNLLTTSTPLVGTGTSRTTTYAYGDSSHPGDVTSMTDPVSKTRTYTYNTYGNRVSSADPLGETTTDVYNILGQRTAETNPLGDTTSYAHNAFGDVTAVTDPLGHVTSYQYDADRNQTQVTDANGHVTTNTYDLDNELTKVTRANSTTLQYAYDADGNQTTQADGLGHTTTYAYDPLNRLISLTDPLNRVTSYAYDPAGNRTSQTAPGSLVTTYTYDAANELTHVSYSDGQTPAVSYSYDVNGRRTGMTDGTGTSTYSYDSLGRLTGSTDGAGHALGYGYDLAGRLTTITYPGASQTVTRSYDAAGRMVSVSDWLGHTTRFSYDKAGELTFIAYPNHVVGVLGYDHAGELIGQQYSYAPCASPCKVAWKPLVGFNYAYDPAGQLVSTTPNGIATPSEVYGYTSINQLANVSPSGGSTVSYAYDAADEPTQLGPATLTTDAAGDVTRLVQGATTTNYTYNTRGDRTQAALSGGATVTYSYDQSNQLTGIAGLASGSVTYHYNGDGLRMSKMVGAASLESFAWDRAEGLPLMLVDGALSFVTGPGGAPLEQISGSGGGAQALYFLSDQLGSTRALADGNGAIAATYTYNAYGATIATTGSAMTPMRFAGQYLDSESGLYYLRARLYDPTTAQFLTRDPLVPLTKQPYLYAGDDPLNQTDPSGAVTLQDWRGSAKLLADAASIASVMCVILSAGSCSAFFGGMTVGAEIITLQVDPGIAATGGGNHLLEDTLDLLLDTTTLGVGSGLEVLSDFGRLGKVGRAFKHLLDLWTIYRGVKAAGDLESQIRCESK
jgi:RHS repeat-associated protein